MASLVLARKYRSRNFGEMVGQEHVVQALRNALASQRLHHAYLFTGTRGIGKTTVSRILAKSLNCTGPDGQGGITAEPCGVCSACRDIDAGRYVDYVELDAASNRGVDEISQLLDQSVYKPVVGRFKVYMIDEVHMLTSTAFNAMLKTLEEPPEYLKFVLATTDPQKVPVTVLSRCLQFNLRPMAPEVVREHLAHVLEAEGLQAEEGALRLLARAARGSMRDALSLTDQAIAFGAGTLGEEGVRQILGAVDRSHVFALVEALVAGDGAALLAAVDGLRTLGLSAEGALEEMALVAQQMALAQAVPGALDEGEPETATLKRLAAALPADETQLLYSLAIHGRGELPLAPDEYAGLTMVLLRLLAFRPGRSASHGSPPTQEGAPGSPPDTPRPATVSAALKAPSPPAATMPATARGGEAARPPRPASPMAARPAGPAPADAVPQREPAARPVTEAMSPTASLPVASSGSATLTAPREAGVPAMARAQGSAPPDRSAGDRRPPPAGTTRAVLDSSRPPWEDDPSDPGAPPLDGDGASDIVLAPAPPTVPAGDGLRTAPSGGATRSPPPGPSTATSTTRAPTVAVPTVVETAEGTRWVTLVAALIARGAVTALVRELAWQAQCECFEPGEASCRVVLRVERETLRNPSHIERLRKVLAEELKGAVALEVEGGAVSDTPARRDAVARARAQHEAEIAIHNDPLVQQWLQQYPTARIVPGSIKPR